MRAQNREFGGRPRGPLTVSERALQFDHHSGEMVEELAEPLDIHPENRNDHKARDPRHQRGLPVELSLAERDKAGAPYHREEYREERQTQITVVPDRLDGLGVFVPPAFLRPPSCCSLIRHLPESVSFHLTVHVSDCARFGLCQDAADLRHQQAQDGDVVA